LKLHARFNKARSLLAQIHQPLETFNGNGDQNQQICASKNPMTNEIMTKKLSCGDTVMGEGNKIRHLCPLFVAQSQTAGAGSIKLDPFLLKFTDLKTFNANGGQSQIFCLHFTSRSIIFHLCVDVIITSERL
jgi:hypothetical protein